MNCPRLFLGRAINMRSGRRNDQKLVLADFMPATADFAPSTAPGTVDKNSFRAAFLSRALMPAGSRIKPCVGRQQRSEQRLPDGYRNDWPGNYNEAFPGKTLVLFSLFPWRFHLVPPIFREAGISLSWIWSRELFEFSRFGSR
jgi:hypothetical protein